MDFLDRFRAEATALLRIVAGLLFLQHGVQKLFGWLGGFGGTPGATADLFSLMGLAGALETFGGLLIMVGLFTRPVAFVLAGQMAAAYFMAHQPGGFWPLQNGGELSALYSFIFLFLAAQGPGAWSIDGLRKGDRAVSPAGGAATAHAGAH